MKKQTKHSKHKNGDIGSPSSLAASQANDKGHTDREHPSEGIQSEDVATSTSRANEGAHQQLEQIFWSKSTNDEEKTREDEFDEYLADLLL